MRKNKSEWALWLIFHIFIWVGFVFMLAIAGTMILFLLTLTGAVV